MANRRFEMYEYRQVLARMRLGESDRAIARSGLIGRQKGSACLCACAQRAGRRTGRRFVRWPAVRDGWRLPA